MNEREQRAIDRRIAELGPVSVLRRTDKAAVVQSGGEYLFLDGWRLANDPNHKGLLLRGLDFELYLSSREA